MSTKIEWTEETWNPVVGCSEISPGCDNCYAVDVARRQMQPAHVGLTVGRKWTGEARLLPDRLDTPMRWRQPKRVFVNSMSDMFHPGVPESFIRSVWATMAACPQHTFQVLTKRPQRMPKLFRNIDGHTAPIECLPNVWLGTSIESDRYVFRADHLRATPAAVRWLSLEPMLGPLPSLDLTGIDWVVAGGESGGGARPMHPFWVRDIRDRCVDAGVPFLFKQWGAWSPDSGVGRLARVDWRTGFPHHIQAEAGRGHLWMVCVGKAKAGRVLDGREWNEYPEEAKR